MYSEKNYLDVPLDFPFIAYPLNSNYEKSSKHNPTFLRDKFFSILLEHYKSVSTQQC